MNVVTIQDVKKARERIAPFINVTPILTSSLLNRLLGHEIFFKAECFQKVGAFKARGACNTIAWLVENNNKPDHIIANSSGNHAQAVAWASTKFGIASSIYMPKTASKVKARATAAYGANVILCKDRFEADEQVIQLSQQKGNYWIPPFNHEQVIAGQGTAVMEALMEIDKVDAVFAPCGGGGLLSGSLIASRGLSPQTLVIGAEPLSANDAAQSLRTKSIYKFPAAPDTIADGAITLAVGDITFEYLKQLDDFYEVEEEKIIYWTQWLMHILKLHIEPTSAMSMEAVKQWLRKQKSKKRVLVVLSGGNIDPAAMSKIWSKDYLTEIPGI